MIEILEKPQSRALTCGLRSALTRGSGAGPRAPSAFLRDLRRFDSGLELVWVPHRWVLYRVRNEGIVPAEDFLVKEVEVTGPNGEARDLGPWLLEALRAWDKTDGGTVDPQYADRKYLDSIDAEPREREAAQKKKIDECHRDSTVEFNRYAIRDRKHFIQGEVRAAVGAS